MVPSICRELVETARYVVKAETTAPSMMPMRGTTSEDRSEIRCRMPMNTMVPTKAAIEAATMRTHRGAAGTSNTVTSSPSAAHSVVPVVDGSTKRFWVSSCIIRPDTAMAQPARTSATVRGTREMKNISPPKSSAARS
ncbi:hypothetical protein QE430_003449 [Microbacterium testaceum]|nr:hypothetical protein [Microbacterium testaceum]